MTDTTRQSEYLITDMLTGKQTWTAAATVREALVIHENTLRTSPLRHPLRPATQLATNARATHRGRTDRDDLVDAAIGDSVCLGLPCNVMRVIG